jgi:hypothetical protein
MIDLDGSRDAVVLAMSLVRYLRYLRLAWISTGKKTANKTTGSPAYFSL